MVKTLAKPMLHYRLLNCRASGLLEQSVIFDRIDFGRAATDPGNLKNIATSIPVFRCPSTSSPSVTVPEIGVFPGGGPVVNVIGPAARSDYEAVLGLLPDPGATSLLDMLQRARFGPWGSIRYLPISTAITGARIASHKDGRLRDTIDGLSQTILVGERSGRPDYYDDGKLIDAYPYAPPKDQKIDSQQAAWGVSTHFPQLLFESHQSINDSNYGGLFGFHKSGANVALADGSVRLLSVSTSTTTLNALVTRANQDQGVIE
jgi:prepilin-type processing-associated H-X9-DG protein